MCIRDRPRIWATANLAACSAACWIAACCVDVSGGEAVVEGEVVAIAVVVVVAGAIVVAWVSSE